MKRIISVFFLLALLAGCSAPAQPPAESSPSGSAAEPEATRLTPYLGKVDARTSDWFYGLMTAEGEIVTEPVYLGISQAGYTGKTSLEYTNLPVWILSKEGPGWPENQAFVALYAEDGSWRTDLIYHGCTATPYGLFAGSADGAFLLDPEDGRELKAWTWDELRIDDPMAFPWATGDAYATAQWTGEALFLGGDEEALLLDLETDKVTSISVEEWCDRQEERLDWLPACSAEVDGQTVSLIWYEEARETKFEVPFAPSHAFLDTEGGTLRVYLYNESECAVYTPEGEEVIPVQSGMVGVLGFYGQPDRGFSIQNPQEETVKIYDWDGNLRMTLPMQARDSVSQRGTLLQITDYETRSAYYDPETGEEIARFQLNL